MVIRRTRRAAAVGVAALGLSACAAVGPNYALPTKALVKAPAAQGPFSAAHGAAVVLQDPPDHWWRLYDDERLDGLVEQALAANTDLRVADVNLERAQSLLEAAKAAREPDLTINLGASETERSAEQYVHQGPIPVRALYDSGVAVSYDLDLFGRLRRGIEAASAQTEAIQAARDLARVNVAAETVRAYADVCDAGAELAATERLLQLQRQGAALVRRMAQGGREISVNVARQEVLEDQLRATTPALKARQARALYRLATLAGRPPETFDATLADCRTSLQITAPLPVGDGAGLLRRRPDVRAAERRLAAATADIGVETAALYPTVTLGASIGSTGAIKDIGSPLTHRYSIGPAISWRLNQSVPRARIAAADAQAKAELARFDGVVLNALQETESSLTVYARDLDRQQDLEAGREHALKLSKAAHQLQAGGRMGAIAVLEADRAVVSADQALAANRSQISQDQIAVFLALGGGWRS
jgi:NodT family efflux transporter outer membrane factor (OMF) lipoprotein